jgi:hypothetical protein
MPVELYPSSAEHVWNPGRLERLRELVAAGLGSTAIAAELGVSRSAVCGARVRYRIPAPLPRGPRRGTSPFPVQGLPRVPESLPLPDLRDLVIEGVPLLEFAPASCRWPLPGPEDGVARRFCGAVQEPGSSYCARHHERSVERETIGLYVIVPLGKRARPG